MNLICRAYCLIFVALSLTSGEAVGEQSLALSQKPTFRCEVAQTSIERIICLERAGPKADWELSAATWALRFSLDENFRDAFQRNHILWYQSLYDACRLR